ncbi:MAG: serine protease inhibitor [Capsulimonas sp.]|nr:serine protease inhibitor [Capsulimonas sp.]
MSRSRPWRGKAAGIAGLGALAAAGCSHPPHIPPMHSELNVAPKHAPQHAPPPNLNTVASDTRVQRIAKANVDFGWRLLKPLAGASPDANVFYSPFSVTQALTMTMNGAGGDTQTVMADALGLKGAAIGDVNAANQLMLPSLTGADSKVGINIANGVWVNKNAKVRESLQLRPAFQKTCLEFYGGRAESLDFSDPAAAKTINGWVSEQTKGKIDGIVATRDISGSPLVLTNAVYFHGRWMHEFDKSETLDGRFHLSKAREKTLPFMSNDMSVDYRETDQFQAASLPYGNGRFSLDIVLPKRVDGLDAVVKSLDAKSWSNLISHMKLREAAVVLPRFQVSYTADLTEPLKSLGMAPAFEPGANFIPMGMEQGYIDKILHKAILQVDEEGTVAAAATMEAMTAGGVSGAMPAITFRVDHPFVCAVRDNATGTLLFAGVIRDPEAL